MKIKKSCQMPDFQILTYHGEKRSIYEVLQQSEYSVFWALRYIGCPSCQYDLHLLSQRYAEFEKLNTQVVVVLQSIPENVREYYGSMLPPFGIICDPQMQIYQELEILPASSRDTYLPSTPEGIARYEEKQKLKKAGNFTHGKSEGNELQLPAVFLIQRDATILYAHYAQDNMDMPTIDELISECRNHAPVNVEN